jgi:5-methylcytosine-specific restriction endonuclease McrA
VSDIKKLINLYKLKHDHFIFVELSFWKKWKYVIKFIIHLNSNYISCTIFRKKYKLHKNVVVVGLKWNGRNVKRRTTGLAKEFLTGTNNPKCVFCNHKLTDKNATIDHIIPISKGGNNCQLNLIPCCIECNSERGNQNFYQYLKQKNFRYKNKEVIFI